MAQLENKICLIGGRGSVVLEAALSLKKNFNLYKIILLESNRIIEKKFPTIVEKHSLKNFKDIVLKLKDLKITNILVIGYVDFPNFNQINFDIHSRLFLTKLFFLDNESNQSKIFKSLLKSKKIKLLSPLKYLNNLIIKKEDQIKFKRFNEFRKVLDNNIKSINKISSINLGQSIILNGNRILALENFKGTDELINLFTKNKSYNDLIFIKFRKSNQISEIDFPVIGINTIKSLIKIRIKAIILFKHEVLVTNKSECMKLIKKNRINLIIN